MASPFSIFRKNQWTMMAILGVLLMVAFVVFPMLDLLVDSGRSSGDSPVAVELRKVGERLTENQVAEMRQRRDALLRFVGSVVDKAYGGGQFAYVYAQTVLGGSSEGAVVGSWLLARKADDLGVSISNKSINDFLKRLTAGRVTDAQLHSIAIEQKLTDAQVFEWLRQELKAIYVRQMVLEEPAPADFNRWFRAYITRQPLPDGVTAIPPEERYEYFAQTSASTELEILPIKIAHLAAKVEKPSEDKLVKFFEEHKNKDARPRSADLGFKAPMRAKFEYLQADPKYVEALAAKQAVTDQEITKYYEENKKTLYVDRSAGFEKGLDDIQPNEPPLTPEGADKTPEKAPEKKAEEGKKADPKAGDAVGKKAPEKKADAEKKADETPAEEKKGGCDDADAEDACQDTGAKTEAKDGAKTEGKDTKAAAKDAEAAKLPADDKKVVEKKADDKKADEKKAGDKGAEKKADPPEVKFKPLDDALKADIKKQLQTKAARSAVEKKLLEIRSNRMRKYGVDFVRWQHAKTDKKSSAPQPPAPDLKEIGEKEGLKYDRTAALSQFEASEFKPLGETFVGGGFPIAAGEGNAFFFRAYQDVKLFDPFFAADASAENLFVFWKIEEIASHVPKFEDVREQVLTVWKANEARKQANELADAFLKAMAETPAESLLGVRKVDSAKLPDDLSLPVDINDYTPPNPAAKPILAALGADAAELSVHTRPFQWRMVFPNQMGQMMPMLNTFIQGMPSEDITEDFMQKVFSLETGQFGKYASPSQDTLYLLRVVRKMPAFKFDFLERGNQIYLPLAAMEKTGFVHGRFKELEFEYGLEWHRDARADRE